MQREATVIGGDRHLAKAARTPSVSCGGKMRAGGKGNGLEQSPKPDHPPEVQQQGPSRGDARPLCLVTLHSRRPGKHCCGSHPALFITDPTTLPCSQAQILTGQCQRRLRAGAWTGTLCHAWHTGTVPGGPLCSNCVEASWGKDFRNKRGQSVATAPLSPHHPLFLPYVNPPQVPASPASLLTGAQSGS